MVGRNSGSPMLSTPHYNLKPKISHNSVEDLTFAREGLPGADAGGYAHQDRSNVNSYHETAMSPPPTQSQKWRHEDDLVNTEYEALEGQLGLVASMAAHADTGAVGANKKRKRNSNGDDTENTAQAYMKTLPSPTGPSPTMQSFTQQTFDARSADPDSTATQPASCFLVPAQLSSLEQMNAKAETTEAWSLPFDTSASQLRENFQPPPMKTGRDLAEATLMFFSAVFGSTDLEHVLHSKDEIDMATVERALKRNLSPAQMDKVWSFSKYVHKCLNSAFKSFYQFTLSTDSYRNCHLVQNGVRCFFVSDPHTCSANDNEATLNHLSTVSTNREDKQRPCFVTNWDNSGWEGLLAYRRGDKGMQGLPDDVKHTFVSLRDLANGEIESEADMDDICTIEFGATATSHISTRKVRFSWNDPMRSRKGRFTTTSKLKIHAHMYRTYREGQDQYLKTIKVEHGRSREEILKTMCEQLESEAAQRELEKNKTKRSFPHSDAHSSKKKKNPNRPARGVSSGDDPGASVSRQGQNASTNARSPRAAVAAPVSMAPKPSMARPKHPLPQRPITNADYHFDFSPTNSTSHTRMPMYMFSAAQGFFPGQIPQTGVTAGTTSHRRQIFYGDDSDDDGSTSNPSLVDQGSDDFSSDSTTSNTNGSASTDRFATSKGVQRTMETKPEKMHGSHIAPSTPSFGSDGNLVFASTSVRDIDQNKVASSAVRPTSTEHRDVVSRTIDGRPDQAKQRQHGGTITSEDPEQEQKPDGQENGQHDAIDMHTDGNHSKTSALHTSAAHSDGSATDDGPGANTLFKGLGLGPSATPAALEVEDLDELDRLGNQCRDNPKLDG
ncbi:hypothetical protein LTR37_011502 [Vermiconidia calcicola]|uniref:Uncharacterized protein n=1 Tax=Vermiconidia calcicola TaxID=1690605 RepID=A0ACC3N1V0_9PEZI|nr:hypothetical protein LTR37_011502 [Vermiconidia calcicola]